jgi:hypothetical protein
MVNRENLFAGFEEEGEAVVRDKFNKGYYSEHYRPVAAIWLEQKERERTDATAAESRSFKAEEIALASKAAKAAERAAAAAEDAVASARDANAVARESNDLARDANDLAAAANEVREG